MGRELPSNMLLTAKYFDDIENMEFLGKMWPSRVQSGFLG